MTQGMAFPIDLSSLNLEQSLIIEFIICLTIYSIYATSFHHIIRFFYRKNGGLWKNAHRSPGVLCGNGQDDAVLLTTISIHHSTCSALMAYGISTNNDAMFRHGFLLECAYEFFDLIAMVFRLYPYTYADGFKPDSQAAMAFHHIPGMTSAYGIFKTGLYKNIHLQTLILALLLGAAVSCIIGTITYVLDLNSKSGTTKAAILACINSGFFFYCRAIVFPRESIHVLMDVYADPTLRGTTFYYILLAGGALLSVFNVAILADTIPLSLRYLRRAIDGKTPIHTGDIPRSRDSILLAKQTSLSIQATNQADDLSLQRVRRRRSSVSQFAIRGSFKQDGSDGAPQRSSSLIQMPSMVIIEDILSSARIVDNDDGDISGHDDDRKRK